MRIIFKTLIFIISLIQLTGCVSKQNFLVENANIPTSEKIAHLGGENASFSYAADHDAYNDKCQTLVECAIYTNDYELAEWLIEKGATRKSYILEDDYRYKYRHVINAPLRFSSSDEEANKYLKLLLDNGYDSNICGYGYYSPINLAYKLGYTKSFTTLLGNLERTKDGWTNVNKYISCDVPHQEDNIDVNLKWVSESAIMDFAIDMFDKDKPQQLDMIALLLEVSDKPTSVNADSSYRCGKYAYGSALFYAKCRGKYEVYDLLAKYYLTTERLTNKQKKAVFERAERLEREAPSAADLAKHNAEIRKRNREYEQNLRSQMDAAFSDDTSPVFNNEYQTVAEQLGLNNSVTSSISIPVQSSSSTSGGSGFHLTREEIPEYKPYKEEDFCRDYPKHSACKKAEPIKYDPIVITPCKSSYGACVQVE